MASQALTTSLEGKVAVVTGSSRGIGASIALRLASEGAKVVVNYMNSRTSADQIVSEIKSTGKGDAIAIQADAGTIQGGEHLLNETVKAFGKLDVLVLNAATMGSRTLESVDEGVYEHHFNTNVKGPLFLVQKAARLFPESGGRVIFFSTSLTLASTIGPNYLLYAMTKGAVEQMSRVLAKDLGAKGHTVNTISPGPIDTELFRAGKSDELINIIKGLAPSKRIGLPEEVAPIVAFLASPAAAWITGQNIRVNGGFAV